MISPTYTDSRLGRAGCLLHVSVHGTRGDAQDAVRRWRNLPGFRTRVTHRQVRADNLRIDVYVATARQT